MQVFLNHPCWQICASLILLFGKNAARKKNSVFAYVTLFVENKRETRKLK